MRVSVIIVSYNTCESLRRCLESLTDSVIYEVVVIDNASKDGSASLVSESFPEVKLIQNKVNRGFGAANNQGFKIMQGDVALLLNSDIVARPGSIDLLAQQLDAPNVVAAGGRLEFPDGRLQESACSHLTLWAVFCEQTSLEKMFPNSRILSPYWQSRRIAKTGKPAQVDQVMGACLMMRPVEQFDERFFLYCEDTELCRRLRSHGKIVYDPACPFQHELGASSTGARAWSIGMYNRGKELYFSIHHGMLACAVCFMLNRMGAGLRLLLYIIAFKRENIKLWRSVLTTPIRGPKLPEDAYRSTPDE